jgi:dolichol-phosphate mannosyltransferase
VRKALPEASILVVDDNSPDHTAKIASDTGDKLGGVEVLSRPGKLGLGSAYRDGFAWGLERGFEAFVEMDSDFSHDPDALPSLIAPLSDSCEVCIGSRYVPGGAIPNWSLVRRLLSRGGNIYADLLLGLGVRDSTAGFRAYTASVLSRIGLGSVKADSYGFQIEMTYRAIQAGAKVREVPISFVDRELGTSKMSVFTVVEALALVTWWGAERVVGRHNRPATVAAESPRAR